MERVGSGAFGTLGHYLYCLSDEVEMVPDPDVEDLEAARIIRGLGLCIELGQTA